MKTLRRTLWATALFAGAVAFALTSPVAADQVILDDLIVDGSICVGFDCVNGESFGFTTLRLKENNLRIDFKDTSNSASFPTNDWQITANDSSNGGANKFSIDDLDGGRTPFTIEASAPSHSLYVDDGGRIGFGTSTPVVELHVIDGDTPTLRLEQDGSSGFTAQTWDLASNETNFFIRDATNGSTLPFRIRPGAGSNSIYVDTDSDVGLGTAAPTEQLDVRGNVISQGTDALYKSDDTDDGNTPGNIWSMGELNSGNFVITEENSGGVEFSLSGSGILGIRTLAAAGAGGATNQTACVNDAGTSFNFAQCSSSIRYKEDVQDLVVGRTVLDELRPVEFKWRNSGRSDLGFIAEEVAEIEPRLVTFDSKGAIQGVEYKLLTAVLVNALQEQNAELETIRQRLAELEESAID